MLKDLYLKILAIFNFYFFWQRNELASDRCIDNEMKEMVMNAVNMFEELSILDRKVCVNFINSFILIKYSFHFFYFRFNVGIQINVSLLFSVYKKCNEDKA